MSADPLPSLLLNVRNVRNYKPKNTSSTNFTHQPSPPLLFQHRVCHQHPPPRSHPHSRIHPQTHPQTPQTRPLNPAFLDDRLPSVVRHHSHVLLRVVSTWSPAILAWGVSLKKYQRIP